MGQELVSGGNCGCETVLKGFGGFDAVLEVGRVGVVLGDGVG